MESGTCAKVHDDRISMIKILRRRDLELTTYFALVVAAPGPFRPLFLEWSTCVASRREEHGPRVQQSDRSREGTARLH